MSAPATNHRGHCAGFTLIEALIAMVLMTVILSALAMVTAQWLPNWNRGMTRVQTSERLALGLQRIMSDLSAAEMVAPNSDVKTPLFEGSELSVTFVRTAIGPNSSSGLEVVRLSEKADGQGPALVRERARFAPIPPGAPIGFADPVVLIRSPFRIAFSYAGADEVWQPTWRDVLLLPRLIRLTVRDVTTQQILAVSTAAIVHVNAPASCASAQDVLQCLMQLQPGNEPDRQPAASNPL